MDDTIGWTVFGVACVVMLCVFGSQMQACRAREETEKTARNAQDAEVYKACISSQRTASECAVIVRGSK